MCFRLILWLLLSLAVHASNNAWGQTPCTWWDVSGDYGLPGPFKIRAELGHRREGHQVDRNYLETGFEFKASKQWELGLGYRFQGEGPATDLDHMAHRYHAQVEFDQKWGDFKGVFRLRHQWKYTDLLSDALGTWPDRVTRLKMTCSFRIQKDWEGQCGGEVFLPGGTRSGSAAGTLDGFRLFAGVEHELNKRIALQAKFIWDAPTDDPIRGARVILNAGASVDVDRWMKSRQKKKSGI
jgi:hypothetical protein